MSIVEIALDRLVNRLQIIEKKHRYLSLMAEYRISNERLVQLELLRIISSMENVADYLPERPYDFGRIGGKKCDIWFRTSDGTEYWIEIKLCPTNYKIKEDSKIEHSKAITYCINQVIDDIKRLKSGAPKNARKYVLFIVYPLYPDSYAHFNNHLQKISSRCNVEIGSPTKRIQLNQRFYDIYLIEV